MSNGKPCTEGSVSELSNSLLAMPWLAPWAAKMVVHDLGGKEIYPQDVQAAGLWQAGRAYSSREIGMLLQEAKGAHRRRKDTAGDIGTRVHKIVGAYVEGQLQPDQVKDPAERRSLENFIKVTSDWEWLGSEITLTNEWLECSVCHERHRAALMCDDDEMGYSEGDHCEMEGCTGTLVMYGYGGTSDGLARIKSSGMIILPDFKTSNHIAATYDVQCMLYAESMPTGDSAGLGVLWRQIKETRIVHFDKELLTWEVLERSIDAHRPYLWHFVGCARWKKRFDKPSYSTKSETSLSTDSEFVVESSIPPTVQQDAPATDIFIE